MFPMTPIATALALFFCATALAAPADNANTPRSLLAQAKGLPSEFEEHFFDVPLAVRVELDQQFLGEAMVVLSRDDRVTLVDFTDISDSTIKPSERDTWSNYLKQGVALGGCQANCPEQLVAVHYSTTAWKTRWFRSLPKTPSATTRYSVTTACPKAAVPA